MAMARRARRAHPHLEFREGDAENLSLPDEGFDAAVANFGLLHVARPEKMVGEIARVLVPRGRMALTVWGPPHRARILALVPEAVRAAGASASSEIPRGPDFFRFSSDAEFTRLLSSAGLQEVAVRTIEFRHRIPDAAHLWAGMEHGSVRTRALIAIQTAAARQCIYAEFVRLLEPHRVDGGFDVPVCVKLASGRKV
jgi:SAM-dependent methyltransferase